MLAAILGFVAMVAFLAGLSLGGAPKAEAPNSPALASNSRTAPVQAGSVSRELWEAYLSGSSGSWALCAVAAEITCHPILAQPSARFSNFDALPFTTTTADWELLRPDTVAPAHYILAGPVLVAEPQVVIAGVSADGVGTLLGAEQTRWGGKVWADLGFLGAGRYLAETTGLALGDPDVEGRSTAQLTEWASAFVVR
ncbi:MAG: hypothetical protein ABI409_02285 [Ramlibacter sp.]